MPGSSFDDDDGRAPEQRHFAAYDREQLLTRNFIDLNAFVHGAASTTSSAGSTSGSRGWSTGT